MSLIFSQTAINIAAKIPGDWAPDLPTPPTQPPPPKPRPLPASFSGWEDSVPWMAPPNFWLYW